MYFGVAYYPEHWPEERWETDAKMMQESGINAVRMGEFSWSRIEKQNGEYDFSWLDRAIDLLAGYGIKTMMCTCSRTPPPGLFKKYPEIINTLIDGQKNNFGARYTVCLNNPDYDRIAKHIDETFIRYYTKNKNVIAWQIDNEIGARNACYCQTCQQKFIKYLKQKYQSVSNLNEKWGAHFWSFAFKDFSEVPTPKSNPNLSLEWARFQSKINVDFALWRYNLIKKLNSEQWITTNFQFYKPTHTDIFHLGKATDIYGTNFYPPGNTEFGLDFCRGNTGKFIILEQRTGQPHWASHTKPGYMRLWAWQSIAHGARGINFFRWRPCRWGQEKYWHAVLPHSGRKNRRFYELQKMGKEISQIGDLINTTKPLAECTIIISYESRWAFNAVYRKKEELKVINEACAYHNSLMKHNITTDAMDTHADIHQYKLVICPRLYCLDQQVSENLINYVNQGGILCLTPRSGVVNEYNMIFNNGAPGPLAKICGISVDDYGTLETPVKVKMLSDNLELTAESWADEIITDSAEILAAYDEGWLKNMPAITINKYGKGQVIYIGTILREKSLDNFLHWLISYAGINPVLKTPDHVFAYERKNKDSTILFLLNFSDRMQTIDLDQEHTDLLSGTMFKKIDINPSDLKLLLKKNNSKNS